MSIKASEGKNELSMQRKTCWHAILCNPNRVKKLLDLDHPTKKTIKVLAALRNSTQLQQHEGVEVTGEWENCRGEGRIGKALKTHLNLSHCLNLLLSLSNLYMKMVNVYGFVDSVGALKNVVSFFFPCSSSC